MCTSQHGPHKQKHGWSSHTKVLTHAQFQTTILSGNRIHIAVMYMLKNFAFMCITMQSNKIHCINSMRSQRCKFNIKMCTVQCHYSALPFTHTKLIGDWLVICIYSCGSHLPSGERFGVYSSAKVAHIHLVLYSAHQCATPTFHRLAHMRTHFPATPLLLSHHLHDSLTFTILLPLFLVLIFSHIQHTTSFIPYPTTHCLTGSCPLPSSE